MSENICKYCDKKFKKLSTMAVHVCEPKRRHLAKDEKHVRLAYQTFVRFFELTQKNSKKTSYDDFTKSQFYNGFIKFGSFLSNTEPMYIDKFIDYVIKSGFRLDNWCKDALYDSYVVQLIKTESVTTALERSILHMQSWADDNNSDWNLYFDSVSTHRAVFDLKDGKISPWLLLNSPSGKRLLNLFADDQLTMLSVILDPVFWSSKFKSNPDDMMLVRDVVTGANL